jgi:hypothetical protein
MPAQEREELSRRQMQYALKLKREVHDQKNQAALQQARLEKEKVAQQARREKEQTAQQTRREKEHAAPQARCEKEQTAQQIRYALKLKQQVYGQPAQRQDALQLTKFI